MTKLRIILKSSTDATGKKPVLLLLSDRGKREYFSTGFSASLKEFDTECGRFSQGKGIRPFIVERREPDGSTKSYSNKEANDKLSELENRAKDILRRYSENHTDWGFEQFRSDFINAPKRGLFYGFAESVIEKEYLAQGRFKKASIARDALESIRRYDSSFPKKSFQDITANYIQGYIKNCQKEGNSNNTIGIRLREIRRFYNIAIREKLVSPELYPFSKGGEDGKVRIPKTEQNRTDQYLPIDSMKKLATAEVKDFILDRTRHLFLFSYYCRGINWKDMSLLTSKSFYNVTVRDEITNKSHQVKMMKYKRSKTQGAFDIQVTSNIQRELDWFAEHTPLYKDYVLPIVSMDVDEDKFDQYIEQIRKRFNRSLKELAKVLGLPESQQKVSIYSARHSFAMGMQEKGRPIEITSQALGHQSVETTKHYLAKFSTTRMAEETDINLLDD